jgi:hypothetical protein
MTEFIGRGTLEKYSQILEINQPLRVVEISKLLKLPKELSDNLIVVSHNKKMNEDEFIQNEDQIYIFFAAMGG